MCLKVALIGSSGGGTATMGHTDAGTLLETIHRHLNCINASLVQAVYVSLEDGKPMDAAQPATDKAALFVVKANSDGIDPKKSRPSTLDIRTVATDTLERINEQYAKPMLDQQLAADIRNGKIDALICISMHVPMCRQVLQAAVDRNIPVTGSGGSSLGQAAAMGVRLAGNAGGSVATTTQTRALSYTYSLARAFGRTHLYKPWELGHPNGRKSGSGPSWTSVINAALPAFWAVVLTRWFFRQIQNPSILKHCGDFIDNHLAWLPSYFSTSDLVSLSTLESELKVIHFALDHYLLPTACAILMATSTASASSSLLQESSSTAMASSIMACAAASFGFHDSVVTGLVAGYWIQRLMEKWVMIPCIMMNLPATMTTLCAAGGFGSIIGLFSLFVIAPMARSVTTIIRWVIRWTIVDSAWDVSEYFPVMAAFVWGCLSCYSSKVGFYHAVHLPLILLELEINQSGVWDGGEEEMILWSGGSFLGAVDFLSLVMVCAGICAAKVFTPTTNAADRAVCRRGLVVNLLCGDFVEVCYPYMEQSIWINVSGYLGSGLSCAWLVAESVLSAVQWSSSSPSTAQTVVPIPGSFAYLPWGMSILLAGDYWLAMLQASLVAFGFPFLGTLLADRFVQRSPTKAVRNDNAHPTKSTFEATKKTS